MSLIVPTVLLCVLPVGSIAIMAPDLEGRGARVFLSAIQEARRVKKGFLCFAEGAWCNGAARMIVGASLVWVGGSKMEPFFSFAEISVQVRRHDDGTDDENRCL